MKVGKLRDELVVFDDDKDVVIVTREGIESIGGIVAEFHGGVGLTTGSAHRQLWGLTATQGQILADARDDGVLD